MTMDSSIAHLAVNLTAGDTDARFSHAEISPIAASGDAITVGNSGNGLGTPSPPVTVSPCGRDTFGLTAIYR